MRNRHSVSALLLITLTLAGCSELSVPVTTTKPSINKWTWMGGSNTENQVGAYGALGIPAASNAPGARTAEATWADSTGSLWMFGGYGLADTALYLGGLDDMWKYTAGEWTWVGGSNNVDAAPYYGTVGVASSSNSPGEIGGVAKWVDLQGNLWIFGSTAVTQTGGRDNTNALWKYSGGEWVWMGGSNAAMTINAGNYGIQGVPSASNVPGAISAPLTWTDLQGNFWMFSGYGYQQFVSGPTNPGYLNNMWRYSAGEWTWMNGNGNVNQLGVYGTLGTAAAGNVPGGREASVTWIDSDGSLWLFGGFGYGGNSLIPGCLNDVWKYSSGQWTWMGGSNSTAQAGTYGTQGIAAPGNIPGARSGSASWTDSSGNLWLFSGFGPSPTPNASNVIYSDLWEYSNGQWTWMNGSQTPNETGNYGVLGVANSTNMPPPRFFSSTWTDSSGNLWLFGGVPTSAYSGPVLNDLWEYQP